MLDKSNTEPLKSFYSNYFFFHSVAKTEKEADRLAFKGGREYNVYIVMLWILLEKLIQFFYVNLMQFSFLFRFDWVKTNIGEKKK